MNEFQHPTLLQYNDEWERYRYTFEGGRQFIDKYLRKYGVREDGTMYNERKKITYCPGFASAAVTEVNNTIFSRMPDVVRLVQSQSYIKSMQGQIGGVDYTGTSIDNFIGCDVLPELTVMGKVGIYVDMPQGVPRVGLNTKIHPYFYLYRVEDIISWVVGEPGSGHEYVKLLLRDNYYSEDETYHLASSINDNYRLLEVVDGGVKVTFMDSSRTVLSETILKLPKIPFVLLELKHSLLKNVADYQIALLNIESTDIDFACKSNFPIYTEQSNLIAALPGNKPEGQETSEPESGEHSRTVGTKHGIRYARGNDRPDFINPSAEPMLANMKKEETIKRDIRQLVHLNVSSLGSQTVSRESKDFDREGLENGLSLISLVLEEGERKLATFWSLYESDDKPITISYPRNFDLRTEEDRRVEAQKQIEISKQISSDTFQREMLKCVVDTLMSNKLSLETMEKIKKEISEAPTLTADPKMILADLEAGLVTAVTASKVRGYKDDEARKAQQEKQERMSFITQAQGGEVGAARGVPDFQTDQLPTSADEKTGKSKRGENK